MHWLTDPAAAATQTPAPLPSPSDLAALDPAVAITLLVVSVVLALLAYIGPAIKDRLRPPKPPEPAAAPAPSVGAITMSALAAAPTAVDQAEVRTGQFIDHLLRQISDGVEREDELEARIRARDDRIGQLEQENRRLETLLWRQRGMER